MKRLFAYLVRVLGIDAVVKLLINLSEQSDIIIEQNDKIIRILETEPAPVEPVKPIDPTAGIQFVTHQVPHAVICSKCLRHVARFTVEDKQIVCANCAPRAARPIKE